MSPAERKRLAEAMSAATGQPWRVAGSINDPAVEGVCREAGDVGVYRVGDEARLVWKGEPYSVDLGLGGVGWFYRRETIPFGTRYRGRGWLDRFVADAVAAVRAHDARPRPKPLSPRDHRRATAYRALLAPDSGASESEREQARRHLERMGP